VDYDRSTLNISAGQDVYGADGAKVGNVSGMEGDYIVVSKGFFFPTDYYIPTGAINSADADGIYLNVTKDEALNQGWDMLPDTTAYRPDQMGTSQEVLDQTVVDAGLHIDNPVPRATSDVGLGESADEPFDHQSTTRASHVDDEDALRVELAEEELTAQVRPVERGAVHIDKVVTDEQQTLDVPVTEERVTVNRRIIDREVAPGETTFEDATIEVPIRGEEIEVDKRARVREEIEIEKEAVTETERVTDTVRREEARITDDTETVVDEAGRITDERR